MSDLKPCPFCGSSPEIVPWHGGGPRKRLVICRNEDCFVQPMVSGPTPESATDRWNRRAPAFDPIAEKRDDMRFEGERYPEEDL